MGTDQGFPTTVRYKLDVNAKFMGPAVRKSFQRAVRGQPSEDGYVAMLREATGREVLDVTNNTQGTTGYDPEKGNINISGIDVTIESMMHVTPDNLPPNIPKEFTPELVTHLAALHEAAHSLQIARRKNPATGEEILGTEYVKIIKDNPGIIPDQDHEVTRIGNLKFNPDTMVLEAGADLPVIKSLEAMGYDEGKQFWLDMRITAAMTQHFPFEKKVAFEHDTAFIVMYFERTGEVLDPEFVKSERQKLLGLFKREMNADPGVIRADYPGSFSENALNQLKSKEVEIALMVRPQVVLTVTKTLLERGELSPMQEALAKQYVQSAERMGYKPEVGDYNAQMRNVFERVMGLKRVDADAPQPPAALNNKGFKDAPV